MTRSMFGMVVGAICVMAVATTMIFFYSEVSAKSHGELVSYSSSFGGDMRGSHSQVKISKLDATSAYVYTSKAEWHNETPKVGHYRVPLSTLAEIAKVYEEDKLYRCKNLPKSPFFAHDAGTSTYSFSFADKSYISFNSNQLIPDFARESLRKINKIISNGIQKGEKLPEAPKTKK